MLIFSPKQSMTIFLAILRKRDLLGMVSSRDPLKGYISDLQLRNQKVTFNDLVGIMNILQFQFLRLASC